MANKLYYLSRTDGADMDEIIDMVIVAESERDAKVESLGYGEFWAIYANIKAEYIGETHLPIGHVVMTATNAG
jgi:hypothetical protein